MENVRIVQHAAERTCRMCINILIHAGLLSYNRNTLVVVHARYCFLCVFAACVLCYASELVITSGGKIILLVQS